MALFPALRHVPHVRQVLRLREDLTPEQGEEAISALAKPSTLAVLRVLSRAFSTQNPCGEPHSAEAKRQLVTFCLTLCNTTLVAPPPITQMKSLSVLVPHYMEGVAYSMEALQEMGSDNTTLLTILQADM